MIIGAGNQNTGLFHTDFFHEFEILFGSTDALVGAISTAAAGALLIFCLLYTPCVAAVSSFKRELGSKWAFGIVVEQCVVAWIAALIIGILMRVIGFA